MRVRMCVCRCGTECPSFTPIPMDYVHDEAPSDQHEGKSQSVSWRLFLIVMSVMKRVVDGTCVACTMCESSFLFISQVEQVSQEAFGAPSMIWKKKKACKSSAHEGVGEHVSKNRLSPRNILYDNVRCLYVLWNPWVYVYIYMYIYIYVYVYIYIYIHTAFTYMLAHVCCAMFPSQFNLINKCLLAFAQGLNGLNLFVDHARPRHHVYPHGRIRRVRQCNHQLERSKRRFPKS